MIVESRLEPDIKVRSLDTRQLQLIVEVKRTVAAFDEAQVRVSEYLRQSGCPIGLIISPERFRVIENLWNGGARVIGDFDSPSEFQGFALAPAAFTLVEPQFQERVRTWLESIAIDGVPSNASAALRQALAGYVRPYLFDAEVYGGYPRE